MLRKETVEKGTLDLIKRLMADPKLDKFDLVGGTALSLRIGHRKSIDIDLFSTTGFDTIKFVDHLTSNYNAEDFETDTNSLFCYIDEVKIDMLAHQYPIVDKVDTMEGVRLISLLDIGAMKLNAIYGSGLRMKDFVDFYFLLNYYSLDQFVQAYQAKYQDNNIGMVKQSIIHHEDIKSKEPIDFMGLNIEWAQITNRLQEAYYNPGKIWLQQLPQQEIKNTPRKGRRL